MASEQLDWPGALRVWCKWSLAEDEASDRAEMESLEAYTITGVGDYEEEIYAGMKEARAKVLECRAKAEDAAARVKYYDDDTGNSLEGAGIYMLDLIAQRMEAKNDQAEAEKIVLAVSRSIW